MRLTMPLSLLGVAATLAVAVAGFARAADASHPAESSRAIAVLRAVTDHYRSVTWTYERAAREHRTPTTFSYRRSSDGSYLQWTAATWQRHAYRARAHALGTLRRRLQLPLPHPPGLHASISARLNYDRRLAARLHKVVRAGTARSLASASLPGEGGRLAAWDARAAAATLAVAQRMAALSFVRPHWLASAFLCIHHYEGAWNSNTGNGYYGGLQMDHSFMQRYGAAYLGLWGTADHWPAWAQMQVSSRAYRSGRGFTPWPNTAAACGLL